MNFNDFLNFLFVCLGTTFIIYSIITGIIYLFNYTDYTNAK